MHEYFCEFQGRLVDIWWDWDLDCSYFYQCHATDDDCPLNYDGWANIDATQWIAFGKPPGRINNPGWHTDYQLWQNLD